MFGKTCQNFSQNAYDRLRFHAGCVFFLLWSVLLSWVMVVIGVVPSCYTFAASGLKYKVTIEGIDDRQLLNLLESESEAIRLKERRPASANLLRKRVDSDTAELLKVLRSQGFYGARVDAYIDVKVEPIAVTFRIDTGPPYLLKFVDIDIPGAGIGQIVSLLENREFGLVVGEQVKSKAILDAQKVIIKWFKQKGFPFPSIQKRKVVVDHATQGISITFHVNTGSRASFGHTKISGLQSVSETFIRHKIPWQSGEMFDSRLLKEAKTRLMETRLFAFVNIETGESLDEKGQLPLFVTVIERKHRTVKAGVSYMTDEGPGGKIFWEHRNLLGHGESFNTALNVSGIIKAAEGNFRKPEFYRQGQSLLLKLRMAEDTPDAFTSRNLNTELLIERSLSCNMSIGAGLAFHFSQVDQLNNEERFNLLSFPLRFDWNTSDRILDPTRGSRLALRLDPYYDIESGDIFFVKGYAGLRRYITVSERPSIVLAGRAGIGSMAEEKRDKIPADIRFYAGGGGSIRGYTYQSVGPLLGTEPIGGRSLVDFSLELRVKATNTMGFVTFIDGGSAFESVVPDFEEDIRWGTGVGFRYFTPAGPLRIDIGLPLNKREGIDDSVQLYISFGQAF